MCRFKTRAGRWPGLLIVLAGVIAYCLSFRGPFIFDDVQSIARNPYISQPRSIGDLFCAPVATTLDGRPFATATFALNYAISRHDVWSYHALNLALHIGSAGLMYGIIRRSLTLSAPVRMPADRAASIALAASLIWCVHPLASESVIYLVQRTELLMGFTLLAMLYCLIRAAGAGSSWRWQIVAVVACAAGMASKEVMVVAPILAIAFDRIFLSRSWREMLRDRWRLHTGLAVTWAVLAFLVATTPRPMTGFHLAKITPFQYVCTESRVIVYYLRLAVFPSPLVIDYADWPVAKSVADVWPYGLAVLALLAGTVVALVRRPATGFLGLWFFLLLAPTSSFMPSLHEVIAERRMYVPLAALVTAACVAAEAAAVRLVQNPRLRGRVLSAAVVAVTVVGIAAVIRRTLDYSDVLTVWEDAVEKRPGNWRAWVNYWATLRDRHQVIDRLDHFEQLVAEHPTVYGHCVLADTYMKLGKTAQGMAHYNAAVSTDPADPYPYHCLGQEMKSQDRIEEAIAWYGKALQADPAHAPTLVNLGVIFVQMNQLERAKQCLRQALSSDPLASDAHVNLGIALVREGKIAEAIEEYRRALEISPGLANAYSNLGLALLRKGDVPAAVETLVAGLRLAPDDPSAHSTLGACYAQQGDFRNAQVHFERAVALDPSNEGYRRNLQILLEQVRRR